MSSHVYDTAYVAISQLLNRRYNNPLGDSLFPLLTRLTAPRARPLRVLDVGCGRGHTTLYWARQGATVVGFDPAKSMLAEAQQLVDNAQLSHQVQLYPQSLRNFTTTQSFDLILVHDVLCYSDRRKADLRRLLAMAAPGALLSLSDYFAESDAPAVTALLAAWGIQMPQGFAAQSHELAQLGANLLWVGETTRQYRAHWADMRARISRERQLFIERAGAAGLAAFEHKIATIEAAVASRQFGHYWALLAAQDTEAVNA